MTAQNRATLYTYFQNGDKPTQGQFQNLIDSSLNIVDPAGQSIVSDVSALGKLDVVGPLNVSGVSTLYNNLVVGGNVTVSGSFNASQGFSSLGITGALTVSGATGLYDNLTINSSANSSLTGNLTVTGFSRLNGVTTLKGTTTNDTAAAGYVGQLMSATATDGSVSINNGTAKTVTSLSLTAGDWDVWGLIRFTPAGTITQVLQSISLVDNTQPTASDALFAFPGLSITSDIVQPAPMITASLASTTTYYLIAQASFSSTCTVGGTIKARRRR